ncbi:ABC transporter permease [Arcicella rosea]|uniref:Putative ABC transport system permease protein n=1 Tax=Arcicella rosea TaxID=502909 RepID=A0A841EQW9_9BACT|nr:ABC transporter permease [Arcicella rosea]MBB6003413.1 putative ABC transport system permease protein [Arcicella rosea]
MLFNYIKIAWKVLLRHPFYTFITLFGITLTLTVLMVITSFIDHLVGSHYPEYKRDRSLYIMNIALRDSARTSMNGGPVSYSFIKEHLKSLKTPEKVGFSTMINSANSYLNGKRIKVSTKFCDATFWEVTDYEFLEGKPFNEQNIANGEHVVVITDAMKKQYFEDETASAIGKSIEVDNEKFRVIGVVKSAPVTRIMTFSDVFFPYNLPKSNYQSKGLQGNFTAIILAKNKSDFKVIQDEFDASVRRIPLPIMSWGNRFDIIDIKAQTYVDTFLYGFLRDGQEIFLYVGVFLIVLMLMGLPAINLVNLNVSRIMERASEIGIRKAFGAPSSSLAWQFIIENIFITMIGGSFALILTLIIISIFNDSGLILHADLSINFSVFGVSLLVCLIFGLLSGVVPAIRMSKMKVIDALKSS